MSPPLEYPANHFHALHRDLDRMTHAARIDSPPRELMTAALARFSLDIPYMTHASQLLSPVVLA